MWLPEDTAAALAWQAEQALLCTCGHRTTDTMDPDKEKKWVAHLKRCHACQAREEAERKFVDGGGSPYGLRSWSELVD